MTEAIFRERLQAIIDWADLAMKNANEFNSHGVRNLDGPVFDAARDALAAPSPEPPTAETATPDHVYLWLVRGDAFGQDANRLRIRKWDTKPFEGATEYSVGPSPSPNLVGLDAVLKVIRHHRSQYDAERADLHQRGKANAHFYKALVDVCESIEDAVFTVATTEGQP